MGDLQVVEEEGDICGRQILLGNSERTKGRNTTGILLTGTCPKPFCFSYLIQIRLRTHPKFSFLKQVSLSESVGQESREVQRFPLVSR